jgi:hypothetical protein
MDYIRAIHVLYSKAIRHLFRIIVISPGCIRVTSTRVQSWRNDAKTAGGSHIQGSWQWEPHYPLGYRVSRHSKAMDQRCSESNGLPKDEDSKLKKEEEKNIDSRNIYP